MSEATINLVPPKRIQRNAENPRLVFHQDELDALRESIRAQGILVPLTVYRKRNDFILLDGERRWRCALKLGMTSVPVIVQPEPDAMTNIMMMFAIHHRRNDWDPLPTALKLEQLEELFTRRQGRVPKEAELAEIASLTRGEVRRLKKLLNLPRRYRQILLRELDLPRSKQRLTVDHVLEASSGAAALRRAEIVDDDQAEGRLRDALIEKFRAGVIQNTTDPRKLARISRAVERGEVSRATAHHIVVKLRDDPQYSIDHAFSASVEQADYQHGTEQIANRLLERLRVHDDREYTTSDALRDVLRDVVAVARGILRR